MRRVFENEKDFLMEYLKKEPHYCTFILGDIEVYGLNGDIVKVFIDDCDGSISSVLMNYDTDFVLYAQSDFDADKVLNTIMNLPYNEDSCISGKKECIECLIKKMVNMVKRDTVIAVYGDIKLSKCDSNIFDTRLLSLQDADDLLDLYLNIDEFKAKYSLYDLARMRRVFEGGSVWGIYDKSNKLIGSASTTAESEYSAMIVNVCIREEYRAQGLAQIIVYKLLMYLKEKNVNCITLYYDNPYAGKLYHKMGFVDKGEYSTLRRQG
jgi:hypothetical protein